MTTKFAAATPAQTNQPMPRSFGALLALIVGLHLVLGLLYAWATPLFEAPDEGAHYAVVDWIARGNGLPVQNPEQPQQTWFQEGSQPPLYYLMSAALVSWIDRSDFSSVFVQNPQARIGLPGATHNINRYRHPLEPAPLAGTNLAVSLLRLFSLLLGCGAVYLSGRLSLRVLPGRPWPALLTAAIVGFNPMMLFLNPTVTNDNLLILLSTASLLLILDFMQPAVSHYALRAAGLGLLLGAAALTKWSGLVLWPIAALGVAYGAWRGRDWRRLLIGGGIIAALALGCSAWWFLRNLRLYGELLGLQTMIAIAGPRPQSFTVWELLRSEWRGFWMSYWAVFGVFNVLTATWVYRVYDLISLWAAAGLLWALARARRAERWAEWAILALFIVLTLVGVVQWTLQTLASQGRLAFGAIAPLSLLMAVGILATLRPAWHGRATASLAGALALLAALIPPLYIAPRYAPPPRLTASDLPANLRPVHAVIAGEFELIGYVSDNTPRLPAGAQPVTLYWRALRPMQNDYMLALHLIGRAAGEVGKLDTWPGLGLAATSQWHPGEILADSCVLPIDENAEAPTLLRLKLAVWHGEWFNVLPITGPDGARLDSVTMTVGRLVPARPLTPTPALSEGSRFEHGITLLGLDVPGDGTLTLYWRAEQPISNDYTLFLHVVDESGQRVTDADGPPLAGDWPTSAWVAGQAFADARRLSLPAGRAPGRYLLRLGFYEPASGVRLAAYRVDGTRWPDDAVEVRAVFSNDGIAGLER